MTEQFYIIQFSPLAFIFSIGTFILALMTPTIQKASFGRFRNIGSTFKTKNIIGKITSENAKANVIYMGHYDSKSQLFPAIIRVLLFLVGFFWAILVSFEIMIGQIIVLLGYSQLISANPFVFNLLNISIWSILIPFIINFLLLFNYVGNKSPGALDNASAVGIILSLAKKFNENPLKNVNLYFVASGAEELGLYGADDYVKRHEKEFNFKNTYFLNYDSPAMQGKTRLLTSFGIPKKPTSKTLNKILFEIGKEQNIKLGPLYLPFGAATDHVPIQAKGYEVAVVVSLVRRVHTSKDTFKYVTVEGLEKAAILGYELAKKIDNYEKHPIKIKY